MSWFVSAKKYYKQKKRAEELEEQVCRLENRQDGYNTLVHYVQDYLGIVDIQQTGFSPKDPKFRVRYRSGHVSDQS